MIYTQTKRENLVLPCLRVVPCYQLLENKFIYLIIFISGMNVHKVCACNTPHPTPHRKIRSKFKIHVQNKKEKYSKNNVTKKLILFTHGFAFFVYQSAFQFGPKFLKKFRFFFFDSSGLVNIFSQMPPKSIADH